MWSIEPERRGGGGGDNDSGPADPDGDPLPGRELSLPGAVLSFLMSHSLSCESRRGLVRRVCARGPRGDLIRI